MNVNRAAWQPFGLGGASVIDVTTSPKLHIQLRCSSCTSSTVTVRVDLTDSDGKSTSAAATEISGLGKTWMTTTLDYTGKAATHGGGSTDFTKIANIGFFVNAADGWAGTLDVAVMTLGGGGGTELLSVWTNWWSTVSTFSGSDSSTTLRAGRNTT